MPGLATLFIIIACSSGMIDPLSCVRLPFTPDLTQAGIAYVCRRLPYLNLTPKNSPWKSIPKLILGTAVELALHRYLLGQDLPIQRFQTNPFSEPEHSSLILGGRRCKIQSLLISSKAKIRLLKKDPHRLLKETISVQQAALLSEHYQSNDLHIFAIATGLIAPHQPKISRAVQAGQPAYLISLLSRRWYDYGLWKPYHRLTFVYTGSTPIHLELVGQSEENRSMTEKLNLLPDQTTRLTSTFGRLYYLHPEELPNGSITIFNEAKHHEYYIEPEKWLNIWIYGIEIIFVGYCTHIELIQKAFQDKAGGYPVRFLKNQADLYRFPLCESHPFKNLVEWIHTWKGPKEM